MIRGQYPEEVAFLIELILRKIGRINNALEIGINDGGSLIIWVAMSMIDTGSLKSEDSLIIGIDAFNTVGNKFINEKNVHLLFGKSEDVKIITNVKKLLSGKLLDFLFIDGGHDYEQVKKDFMNYSMLVRNGGIIAFHDIEERSYGVKRFFNEIIEKSPGIEYYKFCLHSGNLGTGILIKSNNLKINGYDSEKMKKIEKIIPIINKEKELTREWEFRDSRIPIIKQLQGRKNED